MAYQDTDFDTERIIGEPFEDLHIPEELPLIPLRDTVVFSHMILPLQVGRESSVLATEKALTQDRLVFLTAQKDPLTEEPKPEDLYSIGTVAVILRIMRVSDGNLKILVQGLKRAKVIDFTAVTPFFRVKIEPVPDLELTGNRIEIEALMRNVRELSERILLLKDLLTPDVSAILNGMEEPGQLADLVASNLRLKTEHAQALLELTDPLERLKRVNEYLAQEREVSEVQARIQSEAREEMAGGRGSITCVSNSEPSAGNWGNSKIERQSIRNFEANWRRSACPPRPEKRP